jgi:hypothetical protein
VHNAPSSDPARVDSTFIFEVASLPFRDSVKLIPGDYWATSNDPYPPVVIDPQPPIEYSSAATALDLHLSLFGMATAGSSGVNYVFSPDLLRQPLPAQPSFVSSPVAPGPAQNPALAYGASGQAFAVWEGIGQGGTTGIFGRLLSGDGTPLGPAFAVNTSSMSFQSHPSIVATSGGGFVVVWDGPGQFGPFSAIIGRRYDAGGSPVGPEFQVSNLAYGNQQSPKIAAIPDGGFGIVWESEGLATGYLRQGAGIFNRLFDVDGQPLGGDSAVDTVLDITTTAIHSSIDYDENGTGIVVWDQSLLGGGADVFGRLYGPNGLPLALPFRISPGDGGSYESPSVAMLRSGGYVAAWEEVRPEETSLRFTLLRVAEPASVATFALGAIGLVFAARSQRRAATQSVRQRPARWSTV